MSIYVNMDIKPYRICDNEVEADLLPCPFCGKEAHFAQRTLKPFEDPGILCGGCGVFIVYNNLVDTVNLWNTRRPLDENKIKEHGRYEVYRHKKHNV